MSKGNRSQGELAGKKTGAGAAGAGSGTLLVLLANNLPSQSPLKPWLVLIAPSLSVAVSVLYYWVRRALDSYLEQRKRQRFIAEAKTNLDAALKNPNTSEEHRKRLQREFE